MNSALPGEAGAPGAAEAERVRQEVAHPGWRLDAPAGMPAQRVAPAGLWYALTAALLWFRPDPLLHDLAAHAGNATARLTAKNTEHPPAHLRLAGGPWPWRPTTLFALTVAAAVGVALLPAAVARRHRP
jgi:hypothetical protein